MKKKPRFHLYFLAAVAVVAGSLFNEPLRHALEKESRWNSPRPGAAAALPPAIEEELQRLEAQRLAELHLLGAKWQSNGGIHEDLADLSRFFAHAKASSPAFAQEVLGWGTKWRFVADAVPGTDGERHTRHIQEVFEKHFFTPDEFEWEIARVVENYLARERQIENRMLVRLRTDIENLPDFDPAAFSDEATLKQHYDEAMARAMAQTTTKMQADLTTNALSIVAGEVLAFVGVRMGVSAGILGTGAATGVKTFGIGMIIAVIVDQAVSWGWDWYADPKGNLSLEMNERFDSLQQLIVHGDPEMEGLQDRLLAFSRQRAELRKRALFELLDTHVATSVTTS